MWINTWRMNISSVVELATYFTSQNSDHLIEIHCVPMIKDKIGISTLC